MVLWVDLHRPRRFAGLDLHPAITTQLLKLVESGDIPHLLFYGPPGGGKKTRINAFLYELFGPAVEKVRVTQRIVEGKSKKVEISSLQSPFHTEINPSDAGSSDTLVVQDVIKDIAQTHSVTQKFGAKSIHKKNVASTTNTTTMGDDNDNTTTTTMNDTTTTNDKKSPPPYKIVVLHEVDQLSTDAQHGLRRTMELYTKTCRLILSTDSLTHITAPLKSRCFLIRIPSPDDIEVSRILTLILKRQNVTLAPHIVNSIVEHCEGNLRRAILCLESTYISSLSTSAALTPSPNTTTSTSLIKLPDWELLIASIAVLILQQQTPSQLLLIRTHLYDLLTGCIPPDTILTHLTLQLCNKLSTSTSACHSIIRWAAYYDQRLSYAAKSVVHLEAFVSKCMAVITYENEFNKQ